MRRAIFHPDLPNCAFVGYAFGFVSIPVVAELQAKAAANVLGGQLELPSSDQQKADVEATVETNGWGTTLWLTDNRAFRDVAALAEPKSTTWSSVLRSYALPAAASVAAATMAAMVCMRTRR